jgi:hypothetical protein
MKLGEDMTEEQWLNALAAVDLQHQLAERLAVEHKITMGDAKNIAALPEDQQSAAIERCKKGKPLPAIPALAKFKP